MRANSRLAEGTWVKSSRSGGDGNCVQVAVSGDTMLISDSKYLRDPANDPTQLPVITVPVTAWPGFLNAVATCAPESAAVQIHSAHDMSTALRADGVELHFTPAEWEAFVAGVLDGEFDLPQPVTV